ncbi:MAG: nitroreductase family protein [Myxococcota bacterium]
MPRVAEVSGDQALSVHEALYTLRAMRRLRPDPVPEHELRYLIDAATQAPTGSNAQTWAFVVITETETRRRIAKIYREIGQALVRPTAEGAHDTSEETRRIYRRAMILVEELADVPALILVCCQGHPPASAAESSAYYGSIYPAVQNLLLAARSRGLGTTLTTLHKAQEERIKQILGIPDDVETIALIPVGYPRGRWGRPRRRPSAEVTHWERWGQPRPASSGPSNP